MIPVREVLGLAEQPVLVRRVGRGEHDVGGAGEAGGALEVIPTYGFTFLGGQYFFAGDKSKLNGNFTANAAP